MQSECIRLLDSDDVPGDEANAPNGFPREALTEMTQNYTDSLPKTVRVRSGDSERAKIGKRWMLRGDRPLRDDEFTELSASGTSGNASPLGNSGWGRQVICYGRRRLQRSAQRPSSRGRRGRARLRRSTSCFRMTMSKPSSCTRSALLSVSARRLAISALAIYRLPSGITRRR